MERQRGNTEAISYVSLREHCVRNKKSRAAPPLMTHETYTNFFHQDHAAVGEKRPAFYCVPVMDKPSLWRFHEVYMLLLILVIPTCIRIVAYGSISCEIWNVMQKRYDMTSGQA
jgi:hypothetical protein